MKLSYFYKSSANSVLYVEISSCSHWPTSFWDLMSIALWSFQCPYRLFQRKWHKSSDCGRPAASKPMWGCAVSFDLFLWVHPQPHLLLPSPEHYWPGWLSWPVVFLQTCSGGVEKVEGESRTKQESMFHAKSEATSLATSYVMFLLQLLSS